MKKTFLLSLSLTLVAGCAKSPAEKIELAHQAMRSHLASDVAADIEPGSARLFDNIQGKSYVCGRATVRQPRDAKHGLIQRYIVTMNDSLSDGIGRFEAHNDEEFSSLWTGHCPGYTLASIAGQTHISTMDEWKQAFAGTYKETDLKDTNDGSMDFTARFPADGRLKSTAIAFGRMPLERNLWLFQGMYSNLLISTGLYSAVLVERGKMPQFALQPFYLGSGSGLGLNHISVIADGDVLYEHDVQSHVTRREQYQLNVMEKANDVLPMAAVTSLHKALAAKQVFIVLRGNNGNEKLTERQTADFLSELATSLAIYGAFSEALRDHLPPAPPSS